MTINRRALRRFRGAPVTPSPTPTPTPTPADYTVSSLADLNTTLATIGAAGGKVIDLAPGDYGQWTPAARVYVVEVTIRSQDANNPATMYLDVGSGREGIKFQFIKFSNPNITAAFQATVKAQSIKRWTFDQCKFRGTNGVGRGLYLIGFDNVAVTNCDFQGFSSTIIVAPYNKDTCSTNFSVTRSSLQAQQSDGFTIQAIDGVTLHENYLSHFNSQTGDHSDAIQFFQNDNKDGNLVSHPDTVASKNISVKRNFIRFTYSEVSDTKGRGQGIFITEGSSSAPVNHENVDIQDNVILASLGNGIALDYCTDGTATIKGNRILDVDLGDGTHNTPRMVLQKAPNVLAQNNSAPSYQVTAPASLAAASSNNVTDATLRTTEQADAEEAAWKALYTDVPYASAF